MKHFGYNFKFGGKNRFHSKIDLLGTWVGFSGLFFTIILTSVAKYGQSALGNAIFLVFMCYGGYLLASTSRLFLCLFVVATFISSITFGYEGLGILQQCATILNSDAIRNCETRVAEVLVVAGYLFNLALVSGILLFKNRQTQET